MLKAEQPLNTLSSNETNSDGNETSFKLAQPQKAACPMNEIVFGISITLSFLHCQNKFGGKVLILEGKIIDSKEVHFSNAPTPIFSTLSGIDMCSKLIHPEKA